MAPMPSLDDLLDLMAGPAGAQHFGEPVSILEHQLQCARLAERGGAPETLVAAAFLHDVGWLLPSLGWPGPYPAAHEEIGSAFLVLWFGLQVSEPVRLHVLAKRYLCRPGGGYEAELSAESRATLISQGGPLDDQGAPAFKAEPFAEVALALRRWDDQAKVAGVDAGPFSRYADLARRLAATR
jgi:gamma-butyrobetaine dioxygenase